MVCPIHSTQRDMCRQYQKKYREKVHSVSVLSSLEQELEVRGWEGRVVMGGEGGYGRGLNGRGIEGIEWEGDRRD